MLPPDEAAAWPYSNAERARIAEWRKHYFIGTPASVAAKVLATAARYDADEVLTVTWAHDPSVRRRSFELLAGAFGLEAA